MLSGCSTVSHSTYEKVVAPITIRAPKTIPVEMTANVPQFVAALKSKGFLVGKTDNPKALDLVFEFSGSGVYISASVGLWRDGVPLLAVSSTNSGWGTLIAHSAAADGRIGVALDAFKKELSEFNVEIMSNDNDSL